MFNLPDKLTRFLTSPVFDDKEKTRIAGRLNIILLWGLALVAAVGIVNVATSPPSAPPVYHNLCAPGRAVGKPVPVSKGIYPTRQAAVPDHRLGHDYHRGPLLRRDQFS